MYWSSVVGTGHDVVGPDVVAGTVRALLVLMLPCWHCQSAVGADVVLMLLLLLCQGVVDDGTGVSTLCWDVVHSTELLLMVPSAAGLSSHNWPGY